MMQFNTHNLIIALTTTVATTLPSLTAAASSSFVRKQDLEDLISQHKGNPEKWLSMDPLTDFLPLHDNNNNNKMVEKILQDFRQGSATHSVQSQRKERQRRHRRRLLSEDEEHQRHLSEDDYYGATDDAGYLGDGGSYVGPDSAVYRIDPFTHDDVDGNYDEYQTAWRVLGFMIDCDDTTNVYYYNNYGNEDSHDSRDNAGTGEGCQRYVLWAAYVDMNYQGGGLGEYMFWDQYYDEWNKQPCKYNSENNGRCVKMDCHDPDTETWSLLGFFKHRSIDDWMEQLFKHEGYCVWSEEQYEFMSDAREQWPDGCIVSGTTTQNGDGIYYDIKPVAGGSITVGLYTDTRCTLEYQSQGDDDPINVENVIGNLLEGGSGDRDGKNNNNNNGAYDSLENALAAWDSAFSIWKICQPCVAYDLNNVGYNTDDDSYKGSNYGGYRYGYDDDYAYNYYYGQDYGNDFDCYDDADYTNVNQCMKFMAKTNMNSATFRDLNLASLQGTLVDNPISGWTTGRAAKSSSSASLGVFRHASESTFGTYFFFIMSVIVLGKGLIDFRKQRRSNREISNDLNDILSHDGDDTNFRQIT